jgi:hypothetical protein
MEQHRPGDALVLAERGLAIRTAAKAGPAKLAISEYTLARALWAVAPASGRDRTRALELALKARAALSSVEGKEKNLAQVETWIAEHVE